MQRKQPKQNIKRIIIYTATILLLFLIGSISHSVFVKNSEIPIRFSIVSVYAFYAIACLIIYGSIEALYKILPNETGYIFLALTFIKIGFLMLIFQEQIFSKPAMNYTEKLVLTIPFFMFLFMETFVVAKVLNQDETK